MKNGTTLLTRRTPREVVAAVLAELRGDVMTDGSMRGTSDEWERRTRIALRERYGEANDARVNAARSFLHEDERTAAALVHSGLIRHPRVVLALIEWA